MPPESNKYVDFFEHGSVGLHIVGADGTILEVNQCELDMLGYSREELVGKTPYDLHVDRHVVDDIFRRLRAGETLHNYESRMRRKDGSIIDVHINSNVCWVNGEFSHTRCFVRDVTELKKKREQELGDREARLRAILETAADAILYINSAGQVESFNPAAERLFGYSAEEILGRNASRLMASPYAEEHDELIANYLLTRRNRSVGTTREVVGQRKDGSTFQMLLSVGEVRQGDWCTFTWIARDVTRQRQLEQELLRAKEAAESSSRAKSRFLANMSHEIRTPLNAILGFTELLLRENDGVASEQTEHLQTIHDSSKHLLTLVNDVLDLSKIEAGQLQVERVRCSPHQLIDDVVASQRSAVESKGIALDYHWATGVPQSVRTDPHRFQQLLANLVSNAIKFTARGRVSVVASLSVHGDDGQLAVAVSDTGIGIPEHALESIFLPFVQADESVTRRFGGTGLGLAISRKLAEALGGTLSVSSQVDVGSTFTATIATGDLRYTTISTSPLAHERSGDPARPSPQADLTGVRVLLVEDGDTNRKLVRLLLARRGAHVTTAEHGEVALQLVEDQPFDVVIMDMQMPIMDGYTATRRLRERDFTAPIIALTAHAMKGDREKCHEAGCSDYLAKPIDAETLIAKVAEAVDVNRATTAAAFSGSR